MILTFDTVFKLSFLDRSDSVRCGFQFVDFHLETTTEGPLHIEFL